MKDTKPLAYEVSGKGVLPATVASDAARLLGANTRVAVEACASGFLLHVVWELDAEASLQLLGRELEYSVNVSPGRVAYREEGGHRLEPRLSVYVEVSEEWLGDVMGDLNRRRGLMRGMENENGVVELQALVPLAELFGYSRALEAMTRGRAKVSVEFHDYAPAPDDGPDPDEPASAALRG